jgi:hypothetical protein
MILGIAAISCVAMSPVIICGRTRGTMYRRAHFLAGPQRKNCAGHAITRRSKNVLTVSGRSCRSRLRVRRVT